MDKDSDQIFYIVDCYLIGVNSRNIEMISYLVILVRGNVPSVSKVDAEGRDRCTNRNLRSRRGAGHSDNQWSKL